MSLREQVRRLDRRTDSILSTFDEKFAKILNKAQTRTTLKMQKALSVEEDGTLRSTAKNLRALRGLPKVFRDSLSAEGYDGLVSGFMASFDGGLPIMDEILTTVSDEYDVKHEDFTKEDEAYFDELKSTTALNFESALDVVAMHARQATTTILGGSSFTDLAIELSDRLHIALGQASTIAATGISTFYRTVADRGFQAIDDSLDKVGKQLEYDYDGPGDKLTRPFCMRLLNQSRSGKTWNRAEIARMDNGQLPNVFQTCGGFNCRHQWIVALDRKAK